MKKVLLIAGGGTLGQYVSEELLRLGHAVDVVCLEDKVSSDKRLRFFKARATLGFLEGLFAENRYDGIVNFIHYPDANEYPAYHRLLSANTDHLIFLSSYRVYAKSDSPIVETSPQLIDVIHDHEFFRKENYALPKSLCERFLRADTAPVNWTIVRPVISFSDIRLDVVLTSGHAVLDAARENKEVVLPLEAKNLTAGLDWAGNSGKLIANLLFRSGTLGEAYTVCSPAQGLVWDEVARVYSELLGVLFRWEKSDFPPDTFHWHYDRAFDRRINCSKILAATGLTANDFTPIPTAIKHELSKLHAL